MTTNNDSNLPAWENQFRDWEGSIQDLSDLASVLQAALFPEPAADADEPLPNVRLLRHYLTIGLLTRGERRGREGVFGLRQLLEYLAARAMLRDGWPLAKIASFTSRASDGELAAMLPEPPAAKPAARDRTRAQALVSLFRSESAAPPSSTGANGPSLSAAESEPPLFSRKAMSAPPAGGPDPVAAKLATSTRDRVAMLARTMASTEPGGSVSARRTLTFDLAPGCHVTVDERALSQLDEKVVQILVERLRRALREALRNPGGHDATT